MLRGNGVPVRISTTSVMIWILLADRKHGGGFRLNTLGQLKQGW